MTDSDNEQVVPVEQVVPIQESVVIPPPKKRRTWLWVLLGLLALFGLIGMCSGGGNNEVAAPETEATVAETLETEPEPIIPEEPMEAAEPDGSMEHPFAFGTETTGQGATGRDWSGTITAAPQDGTEEILSQNPTGSVQPDSGMRLYLVPVSLTYNGTTASPAVTFSYANVGFVADDGSVFEGGSSLSAACRHNYVPNDVLGGNAIENLAAGGSGRGPVQPGETVTGNLCVQIPEGARGKWMLALGLLADPVYFAN